MSSVVTLIFAHFSMLNKNSLFQFSKGKSSGNKTYNNLKLLTQFGALYLFGGA